MLANLRAWRLLNIMITLSRIATRVGGLNEATGGLGAVSVVETVQRRQRAPGGEAVDRPTGRKLTGAAPPAQDGCPARAST